MKRHLASSLATVAFAAFAAGCWELPPMESQQIGYRGTGMEQIDNKDTVAAKKLRNVVPVAQPAVKPEGPPVSRVYKNVKVLGNLTEVEFLRTMTAMTEWVSPEQGCAYCHNEADLASEEKYAYVVSRRMLQMTQHINNSWGSHVAPSGVTCYTCHRGQPVPSNIWFKDPGPKQAGGQARGRDGQNMAAAAVGFTAMPYDPFTPMLQGKESIRVVSQTVLPVSGAKSPTLRETEAAYGLMMHISGALGVNCTYCHNSRSFTGWSESTPARVVSWYGIRMVRDLNNAYLEPLKPTYPAGRLGPTGDAPKANCATCHEGVNKPLYGANMVKDHPELGVPKAPAPVAASAPAARPAAAPAASAPAAPAPAPRR